MFLTSTRQLAILERRANVAKLLKEGKTRDEVAKILGISGGTVSNDKKVIDKEWKIQYASTNEERVRAELETIAYVRDEAYKQWIKGVNGELKKTKTVTRPILVDGVDSGLKSIEVTEETLLPDKGYLDEIVKTNERFCAMLGLEAPKKVAPTNPEGTEEFQGIVVLPQVNE